jgi:ribosomal-protein-alanine N-acetyltransferase
MSIVVLETERLLLRHFTPGDLDDVAALYGDPEVMRYIGNGATKTREQVAAMMELFFTDNRRSWSPETLARLPQLGRAIERDAHFSLWATIYKPDNRLIGRCGLLAWDLDGRKEVEVGYILARKYWGRGLASEAARASRDYGFGTLDFDRLVSIILPANVASQRVAQKNGMRFEKDVDVKGLAARLYVINRDDPRRPAPTRADPRRPRADPRRPGACPHSRAVIELCVAMCEGCRAPWRRIRTSPSRAGRPKRES